MEEKIIYGTYHIADCENRNDIERAKSHLYRVLPNIRITYDYWDGYDCGEAYIKFEFSSKHFHKVYMALCDSATFSDDVNKYVSLPNMSLYNGIKCDKMAFKRDVEVLKDNWENGWEKNIPIVLFFEHNSNFSPLLIVERAKQALPNDAKMIAYNTELVDGKQFYHILFTCSLFDLDEEKMYDFGDYEFSCNKNSFLKRNGIYGAMQIKHDIRKCGFELCTIQEIANKIIHKEPILYVNAYSSVPKAIEYDTYMVNNHFHYYVDTYHVKKM